MAERMYGPVLLMVAFFGSIVLLMVMISPVIYEGIDTGESTTASRINEVFEDSIYWDQWDPSSFVVTDDCQSNGVYFENDVCVEFDAPGGDEHPLKCTLVRNASWPVQRDTSDYWVMWQEFGWLGWDSAEIYISLDEIEAGWESENNYTQMIIQLRYTIQLFFWVDNLTGSETFRDRLDANLYNISAGISTNDTLESISPWTMLGKIMTFRMPGTNIVTNALIAIPIYTALLYIAFAIIRSVIPLLGG